MIFSASKGMYAAVLLGEKTLTTRVTLPAHIAVGKVWAIVPKRASAAWWIGGGERPGTADWVKRGPAIVTDAFEYFCDKMELSRTGPSGSSPAWRDHNMKLWGYTQARIRIDDFWRTPLGNMTEQEARDEGVASVHDYARLWTAINPEFEWWSHLPNEVNRIRFSLPLEVAQAVSRVGRQAILDAAAARDMEREGIGAR